MSAHTADKFIEWSIQAITYWFYSSYKPIKRDPADAASPPISIITFSIVSHIHTGSTPLTKLGCKASARTPPSPAHGAQALDSNPAGDVGSQQPRHAGHGCPAQSVRIPFAGGQQEALWWHLSSRYREFGGAPLCVVLATMETNSGL